MYTISIPSETQMYKLALSYDKTNSNRKIMQFCELVFRADAFLPKHTIVSTSTQYTSFDNTVGKGEIVRNEEFLLFPQFFYPFGENSTKLRIVAGKPFKLEDLKICRSEKG